MATDPAPTPAPTPAPAAAPEPSMPVDAAAAVAGLTDLGTAAMPVVDPLGPGGIKALEAERAARKAAEQAWKSSQAELEALRAATMTEQEKAIAAAKAEGISTATAQFAERMFAAEVRVAAAGRVTDPALLSDPVVALRLLGLNEVPVTAAGDVDTAAIASAVDKLLTERPYLAATAGSPLPRPGAADGGARPQTPGQLTREDIKGMTPEQIVEAKSKGQFNDLLGKR